MLSLIELRQIKTIVLDGGISKNIIDFTVDMYANYIKEADIIKDDKGGVTIKKDSFMKNIDDDKLSNEQKERLNYFGGLVLTKVANVHNKPQRRMSLSLKRHNAEEAVSDEPKKLDAKKSPKKKTPKSKK